MICASCHRAGHYKQSRVVDASAPDQSHRVTGAAHTQFEFRQRFWSACKLRKKEEELDVKLDKIYKEDKTWCNRGKEEHGPAVDGSGASNDDGEAGDGDLVNKRSECTVMHKNCSPEQRSEESDDLSCGIFSGTVSLHCCMVFGEGETQEEAKKELGPNRNQLLRDTARCLATEAASGTTVCSLDKEPSEKPRFARHVQMDLNNVNLDHAILKTLIGQVSQLTHDWVWLLDVHTRERLNDQFYSVSLPSLSRLLKAQGAIYLPLCPTIFVNVVRVEKTLRAAGLQMSLITETEAKEMFLFQGTELVKNKYDLMNKYPDQLSTLGISDRTIRERAESDTRVLHGDILDRYHVLAEQSLEGDGEHKFLKLLKSGEDDQR